MVRRLWLSCAAFMVAACQSQQGAVVPPSFDRATTVAIGCYREVAGGGHFEPVAACKNLDNENDANVGPKDKDDLRHIALVAQTARGEIGAVDLQRREAIDSNPLVPGYTFHRVGELPVAIVLPEQNPDTTFVASFGSRLIQAIRTVTFIPGAVPRDGMPAPVDENSVALDAGPTDLAYFEVGDPAQRFLFVTLPETSTVVQIPVSVDGMLGTPVPIALATTVPPLLSVSPGTDDVLKQCPADTIVRTASLSTRTPVMLDVDPQPVRLRVVEGPTGMELLVADAALPMIHRFKLDATGATALPAIATGTPTVDLAVTPLVPLHTEDEQATERYVYAIDATDRSVMAIDYGSGPNMGAVISVGVGSDDPDRIPLRVLARTLEVARPRYSVTPVGPRMVEGPRCNGDSDSDTQKDATPVALNGVFLFVGTLDGTFHTVDVFDMDAECRGGVACENPANENDVRVLMRRHHPRVAEIATEQPQLLAQPTATVGTTTARISDDSTFTNTEVLNLEPIACVKPADSMAMTARNDQLGMGLYPAGDVSLICSTPDPWLARNQRWSVVFEGTIPNATGIIGRLSTTAPSLPDGMYFVSSGYDFCAVGALGQDDVVASALTATDPEEGYQGDLLVLTGTMPPSTENDPACEQFVLDDDPDTEDRERIAFPVLSAGPGLLRIGELINGNLEGTLADVIHCFPEPTSFELRVQNAFVVTGSFTESRHRVVDQGGACRVAPMGFDPNDFDTYRNFRAFAGRRFSSPEIAFQLIAPTSGQSLVTDIEASLSFTVTGVPRTLGTAGASLVESMYFDPTGDVLYVVDSGRSGLSQYELSPIAKQFSVF